MNTFEVYIVLDLIKRCQLYTLLFSSDDFLLKNTCGERDSRVVEPSPFNKKVGCFYYNLKNNLLFVEWGCYLATKELHGFVGNEGTYW